MVDDLAGKATQLGGRIKEEGGDQPGDGQTEREGRPDRMEGRTGREPARPEQELDDAATRREIARIAHDM
jgi:uncharacterized protein YjbJ (UPF0337 family)